jgi:hypothetical protein
LNKEIFYDEMKGKKVVFFKMNSKIKDVFIISILAIILMFAVWQVFYKETGNDANVASIGNESEKRVAQILNKIDGVGDVEVLISETEGGAVGAVVVCEGANNIRVVMDIQEAVSVSLGVKKENIKVYLKK